VGRRPRVGTSRSRHNRFGAPGFGYGRITTTVEVIELVGNSEESREDSAQQAVRDASGTLENVGGVEVESRTADVEDGGIVNYRTTLHVSFALER
jgi:hypothetical protein